MAQTVTPAAQIDDHVAVYASGAVSTASGVRLLRHIADLIESGAVELPLEPNPGALVDVELGTVRCVVVPLVRPPSSLSPRETEVAGMVASGLTSRAIASALDISLWTVSTHLRRIFAKLGVHNRAEMVAMTHNVTATSARHQWP